MGAYFLSVDELSEKIVEAIQEAGGDFTNRTLRTALKRAEKEILRLSQTQQEGKEKGR